MLNLKYVILQKDMFTSKFPYNNVLQLKYNIDKDFYKRSQKLIYNVINRYKKHKDFSLAVTEIETIVAVLKTENPEKFSTTLGWFEQKQLIELYLADKLQLKE